MTGGVDIRRSAGAVVITPVDGWMEIGAPGDPLHHWRPCAPFAVALSAGGAAVEPFLTVEQVRAVCIDGRYDLLRRARGGDLRRPEEILGPSLPDPPIPTRLRWTEADALCRLAGGTLADETQVLAICRHLLGHPELAPAALPGTPGWTRSPWSEWSEALVAFDVRRGRWAAAPDRVLPDAAIGGAYRTLVAPGMPPRRSAGDAEGTSPPDASPRVMAAAWMVLAP